MKTIFLLMIFIPMSIIANVDVQVVIVSNQDNGDLTGTMVLEFQAKSDTSDVGIGQFRTKFLYDDVLAANNPAGVFSDQLFTEPDYGIFEDFSTTKQYARVQYLYNDTGSPVIINGSAWNKVYSLTITYNISEGQTTTFSWSTKHVDFTIQNETGGDILGNKGYIPVDVSLSPSPLPVELTTFTASIVDQHVILNWATETEVNNYGFSIGRRSETSEWREIGFTNGHGNSNSPKFYSYTDNSLQTSGKYFYRLKQIDVDGLYEYSNVIEISIPQRSKCSLEHNYPNPFNPSTNIPFSLPQSSYVILEVFNSLGERVEVLASEELNAGTYNYSWDASNYTSGIYFYKLQVYAPGSEGNFVKSKKMSFIR